MKFIQLGDFINIQKGKKYKEVPQSSIRYIQIDDLRNNNSIKYCEPQESQVFCKPNDILIAWDGANAGTIGFGLEGAIGSTIAKLEIQTNDINTKYLGKFLRSKQKFLRDRCTGATIPHISRKVLSSLQIPLPPLSTQKKIADILDTADELRQKTQAVIDHYDQLAQSLFLEMFGDPVKNPMGWEKEILGKLGTIVTGSTPPSSKDGMFHGNIPFITPADLESGELHKRTVTEEGAKNSRVVKKGALMVCCIGTIGKTDIARKKSAFNQQINAIEWDPKKVNDLYALHAFSFVKYEVINRASSTTLPILKKSAFAKIKLAIPPLPFQNQFADRIALIEKQKELAKQSLQESEHLFNALLQKAFKGEIEVNEAEEVKA